MALDATTLFSSMSLAELKEMASSCKSTLVSGSSSTSDKQYYIYGSDSAKTQFANITNFLYNCTVKNSSEIQDSENDMSSTLWRYLKKYYQSSLSNADIVNLCSFIYEFNEMAYNYFVDNAIENLFGLDSEGTNIANDNYCYSVFKTFLSETMDNIYSESKILLIQKITDMFNKNADMYSAFTTLVTDLITFRDDFSNNFDSLENTDFPNATKEYSDISQSEVSTYLSNLEVSIIDQVICIYLLCESDLIDSSYNESNKTISNAFSMVKYYLINSAECITSNELKNLESFLTTESDGNSIYSYSKALYDVKDCMNSYYYSIITYLTCRDLINGDLLDQLDSIKDTKLIYYPYLKSLDFEEKITSLKNITVELVVSEMEGTSSCITVVSGANEGDENKYTSTELYTGTVLISAKISGIDVTSGTDNGYSLLIPLVTYSRDISYRINDIYSFNSLTRKAVYFNYNNIIDSFPYNISNSTIYDGNGEGDSNHYEDYRNEIASYFQGNNFANVKQLLINILSETLTETTVSEDETIETTNINENYILYVFDNSILNNLYSAVSSVYNEYNTGDFEDSELYTYIYLLKSTSSSDPLDGYKTHCLNYAITSILKEMFFAYNTVISNGDTKRSASDDELVYADNKYQLVFWDIRKVKVSKTELNSLAEADACMVGYDDEGNIDTDNSTIAVITTDSSSDQSSTSYYFSTCILYKELNSYIREILYSDLQEWVWTRLVLNRSVSSLFASSSTTQTFSSSLEANYIAYLESYVIVPISDDSIYKYLYANAYNVRSEAESSIIAYMYGNKDLLNGYGMKSSEITEINNFLDLYASSRDVYYKVLLNKSFINEDEYNLYEKLFIVFTALERFITSKIDNIHNLDYFDSEDTQNFLISYGLKSLTQMATFVGQSEQQLTIVKNYNELVRNKGSRLVIELLMEIFDTSTVDVSLTKHYLVATQYLVLVDTTQGVVIGQIDTAAIDTYGSTTVAADGVTYTITVNSSTGEMEVTCSDLDSKYAGDDFAISYSDRNYVFIELGYDSSSNELPTILDAIEKGVDYSEFIEDDPYWLESNVTEEILNNYNLSVSETKYASLNITTNMFTEYLHTRYVLAAFRALNQRLQNVNPAGSGSEKAPFGSMLEKIAIEVNETEIYLYEMIDLICFMNTVYQKLNKVYINICNADTTTEEGQDTSYLVYPVFTDDDCMLSVRAVKNSNAESTSTTLYEGQNTTDSAATGTKKARSKYEYHIFLGEEDIGILSGYDREYSDLPAKSIDRISGSITATNDSGMLKITYTYGESSSSKTSTVVHIEDIGSGDYRLLSDKEYNCRTYNTKSIDEQLPKFVSGMTITPSEGDYWLNGTEKVTRAYNKYYSVNLQYDSDAAEYNALSHTRTYEYLIENLYNKIMFPDNYEEEATATIDMLLEDYYSYTGNDTDTATESGEISLFRFNKFATNGGIIYDTLSDVSDLDNTIIYESLANGVITTATIYCYADKSTEYSTAGEIIRDIASPIKVYDIFSHENAREAIQVYLEGVNYLGITYDPMLWGYYIRNIDSSDTNSQKTQAKLNEVVTDNVFTYMIDPIVQFPIDYVSTLFASAEVADDEIHRWEDFKGLTDQMFNEFYLADNDIMQQYELTTVNVELSDLCSNTVQSILAFNTTTPASGSYRTISLTGLMESAVALTSTELEEAKDDISEIMIDLITVFQETFASQEYSAINITMSENEAKLAAYVTAAINFFISYTTKIYKINFNKQWNTTSESLPIVEDLKVKVNARYTDAVMTDEELLVTLNEEESNNGETE